MFSGASDAFDVFDDSQTEDFSNYTITDTVRPSLRKRKDHADESNNKQKKHALSTGSVLTKEDADRDMADLTDPDGENVPTEKKTRTVHQPLPTVTDSFEQDLEREVASAAGLMPSAEGANVVLSHQ
ncbi:hypothetical protein BX616_009407, partial [Lobosporangium transversale]